MDLGKPFERITMVDAVKKYADVDFTEITTDEEAKALADKHHIEYEDRHKKGDILALFFEGANALNVNEIYFIHFCFLCAI